MDILPLYASLLGFLFFYLSIRTIGLRRRLKIAIGDQANQEMLRAMRVHSNFSEYVPLTLILIYLVEIQGANQLLVHLLGASLLVGRLIHSYGVSKVNEDFKIRVTGMAFTFTAMLTSSGYLLFKSLL
jgi:uncharacterized membrane protein YecN with MAPEG domain